MDNVADFFGLEFNADYLLFADKFEDMPAVYVVYTLKECLDIGESEHLQESLETHKHIQSWVKKAGKGDIYVAVHFDDEKASRDKKEVYLRSKMNPFFK